MHNSHSLTVILRARMFSDSILRMRWSRAGGSADTGGKGKGNDSYENSDDSERFHIHPPPGTRDIKLVVTYKDGKKTKKRV